MQHGHEGKGLEQGGEVLPLGEGFVCEVLQQGGHFVQGLQAGGRGQRQVAHIAPF